MFGSDGAPSAGVYDSDEDAFGGSVADWRNGKEVSKVSRGREEGTEKGWVEGKRGGGTNARET